MKCPCGHGTVVKDGRYIAEGYWRRRYCEHCKTTYTSIEQFCETVKGQPGRAPREPVFRVPKPPKVTVAKRRNKEHKPVEPKQQTHTVKAAWQRIADLRDQREIDSYE